MKILVISLIIICVNLIITTLILKHLVNVITDKLKEQEKFDNELVKTIGKLTATNIQKKEDILNE